MTSQINSAPELYELLVVTRGWRVERFGAFIADALTAVLLPSEGPDRTTRHRG